MRIDTELLLKRAGELKTTQFFPTDHKLSHEVDQALRQKCHISYVTSMVQAERRYHQL